MSACYISILGYKALTSAVTKRIVAVSLGSGKVNYSRSCMNLFGLVRMVGRVVIRLLNLELNILLSGSVIQLCAAVIGRLYGGVLCIFSKM